MFSFRTPTTCVGETLQAGTMMIAQFCAVKSAGLFIIFCVSLFCALDERHIHNRAHYEISPMFWVPVIIVLLSSVKIVCNVLLYFGARDGKAAYMKPWFWIYTVQTAALLLVGFGGGVFLAIASAAEELIAVQYVLVLIYCSAFKYFCAVVRGLILEVERGQVYGDNVRPSALSNEPV